MTMTPARLAPCFKVPDWHSPTIAVDGLPAEICLIQSTSGSHSPSGKSRHPYVVAPERYALLHAAHTRTSQPRTIGGACRRRDNF
jgi:hypothetical protein